MVFENSMKRIDPQKPSEWREFKKNLCQDCWAGCCTLPVEVSAFDLVRLGITNEEEASISLKKLAKRLQKEGIIQAYQAKSQLFILEQRHGRDCIFLGQDRLCTVYDKRPQVCREFPKIGPRPGHCPYTKKTPRLR